MPQRAPAPGRAAALQVRTRAVAGLALVAAQLGCGAKASPKATVPAAPPNKPLSRTPAPTSPEAQAATSRDPFVVRVVWADRSEYRGGIGWTLKGTCDNGKKFGAKLRTAASEWKIDWPTACGSELDVELHVQVNWMRCPSQRTAERVTPGSVIIMPLAATQSCKGHPDDPDVH